jgi:BirA family transcriptional regulator, biotin operon repressor / biotin---[acetyl-CoA-carboxylase] ligase
MDISRFQRLDGIERFSYVQETDSTNTQALNQPERPAQGIWVLVAGRQGGGRGQRGNSFFSEVESGLWVSLVVPVADIGDHFVVNRALALATCDAVQARTGLGCSVKWPNDIYVGTRKLGGILLESNSSKPGVIVAGLGLNVNVAENEFPPSLRPIATSVLRETGRACGMEDVLEAILTSFVRFRSLASSSAHARYRAYLAGRGSRARIAEHTGRFVDVAEDGRVCLEVDGRVMYFSSGPMRFETIDAAVR